MKKILIALAATSALAAGAPAVAQNAGANLDLRVDQLQAQIQAGVQQGTITRAEAMPLRDRLRELNQLERRYARSGFTGRERADLQHRINTLRQQVRFAERGGNGGGYRYGENDRDGRYDRDDRDGRRWDGRERRADVHGRYDRYDDGRDDRGDRRDGRWDGRDRRADVDSRYDRYDDGRDDRDGSRDDRWEADARNDREASRGGVIGQLVDRLTGGGGLRVGQQASAGLYGVPMADRTRFRDGNGTYYRSDGRQIYQIDARTHTVARIYPMSR